MERTLDAGFRAGNDGNRARLDGGGDEILPVDGGALKGAENGSGGDLAMVDGKAGDFLVTVPCHPRDTQQFAQPHSLSPPTR